MATEQFRTLGFYAIAWIEHFLVHGPGDVQGQPIELDDEFAEFIIRAYEVDGSGDRYIRRAFLSRAKGRSKSGVAAMIECFEALGEARFDHWAEPGEVSDWGYEFEPGEPVGKPLAYVEALNVATEEGQAGNTYDAVLFMLHPDTCSDALSERFGTIDVGLTRINLPHKRGFIEPVTSADTSKDGGKSTFIVADETHLWILPRLHRLHGIMTRNLLKRKVASGWMLETSTMYAQGEGSVAEGTHQYATASTTGAKARRALLFDHRQASDGWELSDADQRLSALSESYGPAAAWMNLPAISDSWDDPQVSEAEFRRFWLNQPVPLVAPDPAVIPAALWNTFKTVGPAKDVKPTALAVDMDPSRKLSFGACWRDNDTSHVELIEETLRDTSAAADWIAERAAQIPVVLFNGGATSALLPLLTERSVKVIGATQQDMARACGLFFDEVTAGRVTHAAQVSLDEALAGAKQKFIRDAGLWVWNFKDSTAPLGPLIAATLALWGAFEHSEIETDVWGFFE